MSGQAVLRAEFDADHGECIYCGGATFKTPGRWLRHLREFHPDTIRTENLEARLKEAVDGPRA